MTKEIQAQEIPSLYSKLAENVKSLVRDGIFDLTELAQGLGINPQTFREQYCDEHLMTMIAQLRVQNKAKLNHRMMDLIEDEEASNAHITATRFLLASLHNQSEKTAYYEAKLKEERLKRHNSQTIEAAKLTTIMDDSTSIKFIEKFRQIGELLQ